MILEEYAVSHERQGVGFTLSLVARRFGDHAACDGGANVWLLEFQAFDVRLVDFEPKRKRYL